MCDCSQQQQKILSLETEIEGFKKSIQKEQEQNEKLCQILAKTNRDIDMVKKQMTTCQAKHDALKAEYTTFTRMLHETEQTLSKATAVSRDVVSFVCVTELEIKGFPSFWLCC